MRYRIGLTAKQAFAQASTLDGAAFCKTQTTRSFLHTKIIPRKLKIFRLKWISKHISLFLIRWVIFVINLNRTTSIQNWKSCGSLYFEVSINMKLDNSPSRDRRFFRSDVFFFSFYWYHIEFFRWAIWAVSKIQPKFWIFLRYRTTLESSKEFKSRSQTLWSFLLEKTCSIKKRTHNKIRTN